MITPPFLKTGDKISIVAPAGRVKRNSLTDAVRIIEGWSLNVSVSEHIYSEQHSYLAGTDEERTADLQSALDNEELAAIFCARGGYGITRIIDQLNFQKFLKNPKWIVGFSDITALHLRLNRMGCESIHAIMPLLFTKPNAQSSVDFLKQTLFGTHLKLVANKNKFNLTGRGVGELIGGNLSILIDSIGTSSEPETNGKILIIEEIEEYKYKLDRMMIHLKRAGKLNGLAGLIVGHMTNILDTENPFGESVEEIILRKVNEFQFPVAFNFPTGHDYPNMAWRSGAQAELIVSEQQCDLSYTENL